MGIKIQLLFHYPLRLMRSAFCTLEIRCAIISFVVSGISVANAWRILLSVAVSTALVESSKINIFGFFNSALAIQRRCFCPPDTLLPPCSMRVLYFSRKTLDKLHPHMPSDKREYILLLLPPDCPNEDYLKYCRKTIHFSAIRLQPGHACTSISYFLTSSPPTDTLPAVTS